MHIKSSFCNAVQLNPAFAANSSNDMFNDAIVRAAGELLAPDVIEKVPAGQVWQPQENPFPVMCIYACM